MKLSHPSDSRKKLPPGDLLSAPPEAQADLQIDRALNALNRTPVDPDLSRRLLHSLESRELSRPRERWATADATALFARLRALWSLPAAGATGATVAFGAAAVALLALMVMHHPSAHTRQTAQTPPPASARVAAAPPRPLPAPPLPNVTVAATTDRALPTVRTSSEPAHRIPATPRSKPDSAISPARASTMPDPELAAIEDDLHAPSHPAPRMPLTAQERLIRRLMHSGEGSELAQLDPAAGSSAAAHEQADFHNFFEPPDLSIPQGDPE